MELIVPVIIRPGEVPPSSEYQRVANLRLGDVQAGPAPEALTVPQWIALMDPHVRYTTRRGVRSAALRSPDLGVLAGTEYANRADLSCKVFNLHPPEIRGAVKELRPEPYVQPDDGVCVNQAGYVAYWWGYRLHLNHCLCADISALLAIGSGAVQVAAALTAANVPLALGLSVIAIVLTVYSATMAEMDAHCNNAGCYVESTWVSPGTPWLAQVC